MAMRNVVAIRRRADTVATAAHFETQVRVLARAFVPHYVARILQFLDMSLHGTLAVNAEGSVAIRVRASWPFAWRFSKIFAREAVQSATRQGQRIDIYLATPRHDHVQCWATDQESAVRLINSLPTRATVESDTDAPVPPVHPNLRIIALTLAIAACGVVIWRGGTESDIGKSPRSVDPATHTNEIPLQPATTGTHWQLNKGGEDASFSQVMSRHRQWQGYTASAIRLRTTFYDLWYLLQLGRIDQDLFDRQMRRTALEQWRELERALLAQASASIGADADLNYRLAELAHEESFVLEKYLQGLQELDGDLAFRAVNGLSALDARQAALEPGREPSG
ncbi:MAG: hypothetical protein R3E77_08450 [Steroidobacteraceae bacterium]